MKSGITTGCVLAVWLLFYPGLKSEPTGQAPDTVLQKIIINGSEILQQVFAHPAKYRLQVLYTQIDRDRNNYPHFSEHAFYLDSVNYFYPASTVKLPAAILALEKLNDLNIPGLDKFTPLRIDSAYAGQTPVWADSTAPDNLPSIAHYIKKIFLVSDNDAFNRLYEFLGQRYLNETLWAKGFGDVRIIRRLETDLTPEQNRATNPFTFYRQGEIVYRQPLQVNPAQPKIETANRRQGRGFIKNGELVKQPIDFSYSNYISVRSLQGILRTVLFPESVAPEQRFHLTAEDYRFLYKYMSMLPRECDIASIRNDTTCYDSYVKFFIFGDSKKTIPPNIRIFNKSGQAYGYLIDNAYIVDFDRKIEFLLTAVLQVNENQIYNDDVYEYDEIGIPFLAELGRAIYKYETHRKRVYPPDLSKFRQLP